MARRIRVLQITGLTGVVGLVCEPVDAGGGGPTGAVQVDPAALAELLVTIDTTIETLVFLTGSEVSAPDTRAMARIALLVDRLTASPDHVAAIRRVPAINAAKRVHHGLVVEAVDRETLNLLRPPEVVDRLVLEAALGRLGPTTLDDVINPTVLAASEGGKVLVVEDD